jgi:hypothetical protein
LALVSRQSPPRAPRRLECEGSPLKKRCSRRQARATPRPCA